VSWSKFLPHILIVIGVRCTSGLNARKHTALPQHEMQKPEHTDASRTQKGKNSILQREPCSCGKPICQLPPGAVCPGESSA